LFLFTYNDNTPDLAASFIMKRRTTTSAKLHAPALIKCLKSGAEIKRNKIKSPLLLLPAQIRNKIYGYVLGGNDLQYDEHNGLELRPQGTLPFHKPHNFLAFTTVNRQLQNETRLLSLALNDVVGHESHLHASE
jgi:hypothetical protein